MTSDNVIFYGIYLTLCYLIARNSWRIAAQKGFDEGIAGFITFVACLPGIIPGIIVNLIYRLIKPRQNWSFSNK